MKFKVEINSKDKLQSLLQESYDLANAQLKVLTDEIAKLANSTNLAEASMDEKAKYYKAMSDMVNLKDKSLGRKIEISKLLSDIIKNEGDLSKALENNESDKGFGDLASFKKQVLEEMGNESTQTYKVK